MAKKKSTQPPRRRFISAVRLNSRGQPYVMRLPIRATPANTLIGYALMSPLSVHDDRLRALKPQDLLAVDAVVRALVARFEPPKAPQEKPPRPPGEPASKLIRGGRAHG